MLRKIFAIACVGCVAFAVPSAHAHDGATGVVKDRMDLMKLIAKNTKRIAPIAMGSEDMDLRAVRESAGYIQKAAVKTVLKFPKGSTSMVSEAKDNIWTDWPKFVGMMKNLSDDAAKLEQLAKDGKETELATQFSKMASHCKSCHTEFRAKK